MKLDVWAKTDVGRKREINQDTVLVDSDLDLYIVADGMGGHKGGEVASEMAAKTVQQFVGEHGRSKVDPRSLLSQAYAQASQRIHHTSTVDQPELMGMGTTMVAALQRNGILYIANVGDSRAYLIHSGQIFRLTEDHSLVYEQIKAGLISEEEAEQVVGRNVITRSVGFEREVQVDIIERSVEAEDTFLLCSDGLSGLISDERIHQLIQKNSSPKVVNACIKEANLAGGDDNVSVILLKAAGIPD